jgi:hypothetical protein
MKYYILVKNILIVSLIHIILLSNMAGHKHFTPHPVSALRPMAQAYKNDFKNALHSEKNKTVALGFKGKRCEFKYWVTSEQVRELFKTFKAHGIEIDGYLDDPKGYLVYSLYLDSPDLITHFWREHGWRRRFKARMRVYPGAKFVRLELKHRDHRLMWKYGAKIHPHFVPALLRKEKPSFNWLIDPTNTTEQFALEEFHRELVKYDLRPHMYVAYYRIPFEAPDKTLSFEVEKIASRIITIARSRKSDRAIEKILTKTLALSKDQASEIIDMRLKNYDAHGLPENLRKKIFEIAESLIKKSDVRITLDYCVRNAICDPDEVTDPKFLARDRDFFVTWPHSDIVMELKFKPPRPPDWVMKMLNRFDIVRTFAGKYCDSVKQQLARDSFYGKNPLRTDSHFTSAVFDQNRTDTPDILLEGIYKLRAPKKNQQQKIINFTPPQADKSSASGEITSLTIKEKSIQAMISSAA